MMFQNLQFLQIFLEKLENQQLKYKSKY